MVWWQRLGGLADEVSVTALFHLLKCIDTNEITADRSGLQTLLLILQPPSAVSRMWVGWVDMRQGGQSRASRAVATEGTWAGRLTHAAAVCKECPAHCTDFDRVIALAERSPSALIRRLERYCHIYATVPRLREVRAFMPSMLSLDVCEVGLRRRICHRLCFGLHGDRRSAGRPYWLSFSKTHRPFKRSAPRGLAASGCTSSPPGVPLEYPGSTPRVPPLRRTSLRPCHRPLLCSASLCAAGRIFASLQGSPSSPPPGPHPSYLPSKALGAQGVALQGSAMPCIEEGRY